MTECAVRGTGVIALTSPHHLPTHQTLAISLVTNHTILRTRLFTGFSVKSIIATKLAGSSGLVTKSTTAVAALSRTVFSKVSLSAVNTLTILYAAHVTVILAFILAHWTPVVRLASQASSRFFLTRITMDAFKIAIFAKPPINTRQAPPI